MGRAARWNFFIENFVKAYEMAAGVVGQLKAAPPAPPAEHAKLGVVLAKAMRAKQVLEALRDFEQREAALRSQYQPALEALPALQQQLQPKELERMAAFAADEGLRTAVASVTGRDQESAARWTDPFGVRIGLNSAHAQSLLTWQDYAAKFKAVAATTSSLMSGPRLDELLAFNAHRKRLLREMMTLQAQLAGAVALPQLGPLRESVVSLDGLLSSLRGVHEAHAAMLQRDLKKLDLQVLELRLKLQTGEAAYAASEASQVLGRLIAVHGKAMAGQGATAAMGAAHWEQFQADLEWLRQHVAQADATRASALEVNIQRYQQEMYHRLAQTKGGAAAAALGGQ